MDSYDLKAILGEKLKRLIDKTLKALVDCMYTVGASLCSLDKRVSALESVELPEGGYKPMQEPVASPSASGTAIQFIDLMSQDATGRMTATKKTVRTGSTSQTGVLQLTDSHTSTSTTTAATPKNVKEAYDLANGKYTKPSGGIPKSDLASAVQTSLSLADSAVQDISGKLDFAEKNFALSGSWNNQLDIAMLRILNSPDAGTSSSPEGGTMFALVGATEQHANGFVTQLAFGDDKLYYRTRHKPGTMREWSDWKELAFKSEVNTLLALLATKQDIVKWTGLYVGDQSSPQYNPGVTKDYADKKASPDIVVYNDEMSTSAWTKYGPDGSVMDSGTFSGRFFFDELYRLSGASELIWIGPLNEISDNHYHHLHPCLGCSPKDSSFSSHYKPWTSWRKYKLTVHNTGGSAGTIKVQVGGRYDSIRYWSSSYTIVDGMIITHNATEFDTNDRYNYINLAVGAHTSKTFEFYFKRVERITPPTPTNLYYIESLIVTTK